MSLLKKKFFDLLVIGGFLTVILLPLADRLGHIDSAPAALEKRKLALFPSYEGNLKTYFASLDSWFSDNFGFRRRLIRLHNKWKLGLFRHSASDDVVLGSDGWLFFGGEGTLEYTRRVRVYSPQELTIWQAAFESRRKFAESRDARYLLVIAPNKEEIYSEHLPDWMKPPAGKERLAEQLLRAFEGSALNRLDLHDTLMASREGELSYAVTDTHWNAVGALAATRAIFSALKSGARSRAVPDFRGAVGTGRSG
jgi:alginate O-acetyltransferase complex protein AlgJ